MNCCTESMESSYCCRDSFSPGLWSDKKKLKILENILQNLKEKENDVLEAIDEIKNK